ncbi:MAG: hypothetical protein IAF58_19040 [Leptolyngbya sp.]|nr:hypothetical protein [Candidatus Melainabacteria bacterium]
MGNSETLPVLESKEVQASVEKSSHSNVSEQALKLLDSGIPKTPESHETSKSFLPALDLDHQSLGQKSDKARGAEGQSQK